MTKKRKCLLCDKSARSRGLCTMHYTQFNRAKQTIPKEMRDDFERQLIETGKLLPVDTADDNPFSLIADEFKQRIEKQHAADDATLNAAEAKANYRRGKKRPPSQESS